MMMGLRKQVIAGAILLLVLLSAPRAHAASITLEGRIYDVTVLTVGTTVPISGVCDLIFVQAPTGEKYLFIPSDPTARGDFDINNQRFYMLDRQNNGQIIAFKSLDGTLINVADASFFSTTTQNPGFGQNPLETISRPITIPSTETPTDVCIISDELIGYRTDGISDGLQKIYSLKRSDGSVSAQFAVPLKNADPTNNNTSVYLEFDGDTGNFLTAQLSLDPNLNADVRDRISVFRTDGTFDSDIVLENNLAFPGFTGASAGLAADPATGTIYLLDSGGRLVFVITPRKPGITSIVPNSGPTTGGTSVTINGVNLPSDVSVFFGGVLATNIKVAANGNSITAFTPPHAVGPVDVTVTGSTIPPATPLKLAAGFNYVNAVPNVFLQASPTQGPPPLNVSFNFAGTGDPDGSLVSLVLDYGDGDIDQLPADVSITSAAHTYTAEGTFTATLIATDNQGGVAKATQVIVVGKGGLVLRSLAFKTDSTTVIGRSRIGDTMKLKGEFVLPDNVSLADGKLTVAFVNPLTADLSDLDSALTDCPDLNSYQSAVAGGQFCANINGSGYVSSRFMKFNVKPLKKLGIPPNTHTFTFSGSNGDLDADLADSLMNAEGAPAFIIDDAGNVQTKSLNGKVLIVVRLITSVGEELIYAKIAVVDIKSSRGTRIQLTRH